MNPAEPIWPLPKPGTPHTTASALFVNREGLLLKTEAEPVGRVPSPPPKPPPPANQGTSAWRNKEAKTLGRPTTSELEGSEETPRQSLNTEIRKLRLRDKGKKGRHPKLWLLVLAQPLCDPGQVPSPLCALGSPPLSCTRVLVKASCLRSLG